MAGIDRGGDQAGRETVAEAGHGFDAGVSPLFFACLELQPQSFVGQAGSDRDEGGAIDRTGPAAVDARQFQLIFRASGKSQP